MGFLVLCSFLNRKMLFRFKKLHQGSEWGPRGWFLQDHSGFRKASAALAGICTHGAGALSCPCCPREGGAVPLARPPLPQAGTSLALLPRTEALCLQAG